MIHEIDGDFEVLKSNLITLTQNQLALRSWRRCSFGRDSWPEHSSDWACSPKCRRNPQTLPARKRTTAGVHSSAAQKGSIGIWLNNRTDKTERNWIHRAESNFCSEIEYMEWKRLNGAESSTWSIIESTAQNRIHESESNPRSGNGSTDQNRIYRVESNPAVPFVYWVGVEPVTITPTETPCETVQCYYKKLSVPVLVLLV